MSQGLELTNLEEKFFTMILYPRSDSLPDSNNYLHLVRRGVNTSFPQPPEISISIVPM